MDAGKDSYGLVRYVGGAPSGSLPGQLTALGSMRPIESLGYDGD